MIAYLREFSQHWYAPLRRAMLVEGLLPVCRHIVDVHRVEGVEVGVEELPFGTILRIPVCPAVGHIRGMGETPHRLFVETTRTVHGALCEGTPYGFELTRYDVETGGNTQRFFRRQP